MASWHHGNQLACDDVDDVGVGEFVVVLHGEDVEGVVGIHACGEGVVDFDFAESGFEHGVAHFWDGPEAPVVGECFSDSECGVC